MRLSEKRTIFSDNMRKLLNFIRNYSDIQVAIDDVKAREGHMPNSLHYSGLAVDLIFYNSTWDYLTESEDYRFAGEFWENLHPNCYWGGGTHKDDEGTSLQHDGNHFSMSWDNRR